MLLGLARVHRRRSVVPPAPALRRGRGNLQTPTALGAPLLRRVPGAAGAAGGAGSFRGEQAGGLRRADARACAPATGAARRGGGGVVAGGRPLLRRAARAHLGLLAARPAHGAPPHAAYGLPAPAGEGGASDLRADGGRDLGGGGPDPDRAGGEPEVTTRASGVMPSRASHRRAELNEWHAYIQVKSFR